ncbi:unnamed protein product [Durusdinium trenchii]|uniref:Uncharacterized protein n=1 Tax=Durusdinium trenchii TaxID=1381693 RepID=A0ABP0J539_9DINO
MASQQRNAGAMIRASSFGAMSRELRARAGRVEESGAAPQAQSEAKAEPSGPSRRRSSSSAAERRSSGARRHSRSEPSPALPANWNDLVALSPQVILDRLTKGVEKGRCWLDPPKVRKADGTPPATRPALGVERHKVWSATRSNGQSSLRIFQGARSRDACVFLLWQF